MALSLACRSLIPLLFLRGSQSLGLPSPRFGDFVYWPNIDIDDALVRVLKRLGDVSNRLLNSLGCGSAPEGKSECHQNPAGSKMQSCHLVEAGDAIDPRQGLLQPLHHDGRDRLASDQAPRLVGEYEGDGRK